VYFGNGPSASMTPPGAPPAPPGAPVNCDNFQSFGAGTSFAGVYIGSSYTGTVTTGEALTFGAFELANGAISQSAAAHDLTVTGTFDWTGGTLNSSTTAATFTLSGATATISPGANNTISTGSTLNLVARETGNGLVGTSATFRSGELLFAGGDGIIIDSFCRADVKPDPDAYVLFKRADLTTTPGTILLKANSVLGVTPLPEGSTAEWDASGLKIENNGGEVVIKSGVTARIGPKEAQAQPTTSIKQTAGKFNIEAGATVSAWPTRNGFTEVTGGTILISDLLTEGAVPATLVGNLTFSGGTLQFEGRYTEFKVAGDVKWTGGTFSPRLLLSDESKLDVWNIVGKLILPANFTSAVAPVTPGYNAETGVNANKRWEVLKFTSVELPPNNPKPNVVATEGNAPLEWYLFPQPDGKVKWKLGAKN
jgi:hypothetical protein